MDWAKWRFRLAAETFASGGTIPQPTRTGWPSTT